MTAEQSLRLLAGFPEYLAGNGWDVHVVSSPGMALNKLGKSEGVTTHPISMIRQPSPLADLVSLANWIRLLHELRPDVVSVGTPKAGLLGGIAAWVTRIPRRVYLLRGLRVETATGAQRAVLAAMERLAIAAAHAVIAVSPSLRQRAIDLRLARPEKIRVLGEGSSNGVDLKAFARERFSESQVDQRRRELGIVPDVPVIGFVGRLAADKGLDVFAEALDLLGRAGIDHQVLIVGGADGAMAAFSPSTGSSRRAPILIGQVDDPAIYYRLMDVLCLPTLREGFPNVVLEASASGVPTVTTTATGAIDSVVVGETGLVAEVESAEAMSHQLQVLLLDPVLRERMGSNSAERARRSFDRLHVWTLYERFYRSNLAGKRNMRLDD